MLFGMQGSGATTADRPVITVYRATRGGKRLRYTLRQRTVRKALREAEGS